MERTDGPDVTDTPEAPPAWTAPTYRIHAVSPEGGAIPSRIERVVPGLTYRPS
jgi:hypothetical protein